MHALKPTELAVVAWAGSRLARILTAQTDQKLLAMFFQTLVGTAFVIVDDLEGRALTIILWAARFGVNGRNLLRHAEPKVLELLDRNMFDRVEMLELAGAYNAQFPDGRISDRLAELGFGPDNADDGDIEFEGRRELDLRM